MLKPHTTFLIWSILKRNSWGTHGARLGKSHCIGSVVEVAGLQLRCITVQRQPSVRGQIASRSRRVTSGGTCATKLLPIHLWSHVNCKLQSMVGTYWHMSEQVSVWRRLSKLASAFWCFFSMVFHLFPSDPLAWEPGTQWHPRFYMFLQSHAALPRIKHGKHTEETSLRTLDEWWRLRRLRLAWTNSECWSFMKNAEIQESLKTTSKQKVYTTESLLISITGLYLCSTAKVWEIFM